MKHQTELKPDVHYQFNAVAVLRLRDHLLWLQETKTKPEIGFNMSVYYDKAASYHDQDMSGHECGTIACIAGHAILLEEHKVDTNAFYHARELLGLSFLEANYLFSGGFSEIHRIERVTLQEAIQELNYMLENGHTSSKKNWS